MRNFLLMGALLLASCGPRPAADVEKVEISTEVGDFGMLVNAIEITVKNPRSIKGLTAADFDLVNNVPGGFLNPATGAAYEPYEDDGISVVVHACLQHLWQDGSGLVLVHVAICQSPLHMLLHGTVRHQIGACSEKQISGNQCRKNSEVSEKQLHGSKDFLDSLGLAVEDNRISDPLTPQCQVDGSLGRDGKPYLIPITEFAGPDAEQEFLLVGHHAGAMLDSIERRQFQEVLQVTHSRLCIAILACKHVSRAHHLGAIGVIAVHIGPVVVALLLRRVHLLFGYSSNMLLLLDAGAYHLLSFFLAGHYLVRPG